jgi:hypothetical protein
VRESKRKLCDCADYYVYRLGLTDFMRSKVVERLKEEEEKKTSLGS